MMDKQKLRGADILTAFLLTMFGVWILTEAFKMPMTDSYGGVQNVWYVAPALFPLIIGGALVLLSLGLLVSGFRKGGWPVFKLFFLKKTAAFAESGWRFVGILLPLLGFVYMNIPNLDFLLSSIVFLVYFIPVFYLEDFGLLKKSTLFYAVAMLLFLIFHVSGLTVKLRSYYAVDIFGLVFIVAFIFFLRRHLGVGKDNKRKLRNSLLISIIVPVLLVAAFRFLLMVPMPVEGGLIDLLFVIVYAFK